MKNDISALRRPIRMRSEKHQFEKFFQTYECATNLSVNAGLTFFKTRRAFYERLITSVVNSLENTTATWPWYFPTVPYQSLYFSQPSNYRSWSTGVLNYSAILCIEPWYPIQRGPIKKMVTYMQLERFEVHS